MAENPSPPPSTDLAALTVQINLLRDEVIAMHAALAALVDQPTVAIPPVKFPLYETWMLGRRITLTPKP